MARSFHLGSAPLWALDGLDLRVAEGELVAIVGPNGCGKSTLLRVISGTLLPDRGTVRAFGATVTGPDPRVGLVFQEPRLLPWRDVVANVALPLEIARTSRLRRHELARDALVLTGVEAFSDALPAQLSGGLAQRVALARALVTRPDALLLDEPFSALDALTRERLDDELVALWARTGTTVVLVTHSIPEAVFLADRVVVMSPRPGRIIGEIAIDVARPRSLGASDQAAFGRAAQQVRSLLELDGAEEGASVTEPGATQAA